MFSASSRMSPRATRVRSLLAGRLKLISSRSVRLDALQLAADQASLSWRVGVAVAALEHLHQRADGRERIADLVGDAGGQQAERRHLLLVQHVGLRFLQFARALGDAGFQLAPGSPARPRLSWPGDRRRA